MKESPNTSTFCLTFGQDPNVSEIRDFSVIVATVPQLAGQRMNFKCTLVDSRTNEETIIDLTNVSSEILLSLIAGIKQASYALTGCEVSKTIKTSPCSDEPEVNPDTVVLDLSKLTCLYVEDQVDSQILFKVQMKELKGVEVVENFENALPLINSKNFDFIVMDINLQGEYNGHDAMKMIRKIPGHERDIIIATTAYALPGDKEKFILAGFDGFITKPIFTEILVSELERIFNNKTNLAT